MIVYFDTSALVKRYIAESDSKAVLELWKNASLAASSQLLCAEMLATFARKRREQPTLNLGPIQRTFREDWSTLYQIAIDDDVNDRVEARLPKHSLRGADAVHLASALLVRDFAQDQVTFACADSALVNAARAEGFSIAP